MPDSWQKPRGSATAEEPALKKRRSDAGMNSGGDVLKNLEDEIHQRAWDVSGNSEILGKQLVEIVQMELRRKEKRPSPAQQEGAGAEDTQIDDDAAYGEMERDVAANKSGRPNETRPQVRLEQEQGYA